MGNPDKCAIESVQYAVLGILPFLDHVDHDSNPSYTMTQPPAQWDVFCPESNPSQTITNHLLNAHLYNKQISGRQGGDYFTAQVNLPLFLML